MSDIGKTEWRANPAQRRASNYIGQAYGSQAMEAVQRIAGLGHTDAPISENEVRP